MAQPGSATVKATALQEAYRQRLRDGHDALLDNFVHILKAAQVRDDDDVSDKALAARERYELHVRATNIVRTAEGLLRLIGELKRLLLFQDYGALNAHTTARSAALQHCKHHSEQQLRALQAALGAHLHDLEHAYYSSHHLALQ